jgi:hypothetical protein
LVPLPLRDESIESYIYILANPFCMGVKKKLKKKGGNGRKVLGMLIVLMTVISAFTGFIPVLADDLPDGEDGMPVPSAMTLTADPEWIYINGDESLITATVYDNENYTNPIPNMVVFFETTRGILTPVSYGGSEAPGTCWAQTNESGVAIVALAPVIGSESGNATVKAVTGKGDVWKTATVEFVKAEWRVVLFPDEESKVTEANEDATYYIMVRNAGTADDTYDLTIPSNEADYVLLNKTTVSLAANTSEIVTLTVSDSAIGSYNTTIRAASAHASWEVTLMTIVRAFGAELKVEGGDFAEKKVAPSVDALYSLTVKNTGTDVDSYDLSVDNVDAADTVELNQTTITNLAAGATAEVLLTVSDATVGEYVVNVTATSSGNPSVSDTISTLTNVSVVAKPDLLVTEINLTSGALFAGESNEICATVKNNGTADAGAFNVSFLADGFSEEVRVNGLAVGEETTVCVTDPTSRTAGESVTLLVTADSDAEIDESDETNNDESMVETVVAGPQPDVLITEITSNQLYENQSNEICATVKNNGTADAGAFNVSFTVDGFSGEVRVNGLAVGDETTVCVTDPTLRTAGESVTITVTADSDAEIGESDETNNALSVVKTVIEKPEDAEAPVVTIPTAEPYAIPDDTDNEPLWGESSNLSVVVTDESTITTVTINLSAIGGSATEAMTRIGSSDVWNVLTNASEGAVGWNGTAYVPHVLMVTATDEYDNSNTSICVDLMVINNGDVNEDGSVNFADVTYLANHVVGTPGFDGSMKETLGEVNGDTSVNFADVTYLANHVVGVIGFEPLK